MHYNFKDEDLNSEQRIEEYKEFAQSIFQNMETLQETFNKLRELNQTATIKVRIGDLDYTSTPKKDNKICARGKIYSTDRLRQLIYASSRKDKVAVNVVYQEGTGLQDDSFIDVADISFEYDGSTKEINLGEVLSTEEIQKREKLYSNKNKEEEAEVEEYDL